MDNSQNFSVAGMTPIRNLRPGARNWTITARLVYKTPIRCYGNESGTGNYFTFNLIDESGEVLVTAFDNTDLNQLHELLVFDQVYSISNAEVKGIDPGANYLFVNEFELIVNKVTSIVPVGSTENIPHLMFKFMPIASIAFQNDYYVDVIGMCTRDLGLKQVYRRDIEQWVGLRDLELIDENNGRITLALWSPEADEYSQLDNHVIVVRNALVILYEGTIKLSVCPKSMIFVNPPIPEVAQFRTRFDNRRAF